jgi:predicted permease
VANLMLARSEARRREIAVRTALGAGRGRLFRQLITESCVLTLFGAAAGLLLARASVAFLLAQSPVTFPSFAMPSLDFRAAAFTIGVSLVCGLLVGLVPGLQARPLDLTSALKETARGSDGRRAQRLRSALVVAELAMAAVLLVGAGLMIHSVQNLAALSPGFDPDSLLTLRISIPRAQTGPAGPDDPDPPVIRSGPLLERLRGLKGVTAVGLGTDLPLDGNSSAGLYSVEGMPPVTAQNEPRAYNHRVSPGFFAALRIPIIAGRSFTEDEMVRSPSPVVVSERLVKRFWPGEDPIGKRIKLGPQSSTAAWRSIVGVVSDVKYRGLPENPTADPDVYLPFAERNPQVGLAIRTSLPPSLLIPAVRTAIREADASIPIYDVATMDELVASQTSQSRFTMWLMGVFAGVALVLSVIGIYGVMSYLVTQRTREIGIRLALGAANRDILRLVVGDGARLIAAGIAFGALMSLALQRVVASVLFGVSAADISSAIAVAVLGCVALFACYVPAARAARVDPLQALRSE